jgi:preprotein translocase subunit SecG
MTVLIITIHVIICVLLIIIILIQAGRGGGLVEGFSGVESMFGTKTNTLLTRTTTTLSVLFFLTCLSLAVISLRQSRSLLTDVKPEMPLAQPTSTPINQTVTQPAAETTLNQQTQNPPEQQIPQGASQAE